MPKRSRVTLATVRRLALAFPGVEEGLSYGTPGFRVRGRFLARLWEDGETLVVKCGDDERDFRMKADPELQFDLLSCVCGTDDKKNLWTVYHLYSVGNNHRVRLKVPVETLL